MKKILTLSIVFLSLSSFAGITGNPTIEGRIVKFNEKTVTLSQGGKHIKVMRASIPKHQKIKIGNKVFSIMDKKKIKFK